MDLIFLAGIVTDWSSSDNNIFHIGRFIAFIALLKLNRDFLEADLDF